MSRAQCSGRTVQHVYLYTASTGGSAITDLIAAAQSTAITYATANADGSISDILRSGWNHSDVGGLRRIRTTKIIADPTTWAG